MSGHDLWHIAVLGSTLFAAAGVVIVVLASLLYDEMPPGITRARPAAAGIVAAAGALLGLEWLGVH
ncbi:MAG TPA: hypothetical protein VG929_11115 [Actinomycetota bacterium]|nr:hypothetical protein [Actinomycetota bacterium]